MKDDETTSMNHDRFCGVHDQMDISISEKASAGAVRTPIRELQSSDFSRAFFSGNHRGKRPEGLMATFTIVKWRISWLACVAILLWTAWPSPFLSTRRNHHVFPSILRKHSVADQGNGTPSPAMEKTFSYNMTSGHRRLLHTNQPSKNRILYIVTALAEYNSGTRNTVRGSDRLQETLIPVLSEGVASMVSAGYQVDVFLVCHFVLRPERADLIQAALPKSVGFDVWNDATPLGYDTASNNPLKTLENRTLHLARQHRFVIKDKILQYDIFVVFEDDMLIKAEHVQHYVAVTDELRRLEEAAPIDPPPTVTKSNAEQQYFGTMTKGQLRRMIPGFIRVEVLLDEENYPAQNDTGPVPVDLQFDSIRREVDAQPCCSVSDHMASANRPSRPRSDQLMLWETNILPLGVRQMPPGSWLDWVVLQRGPNQGALEVNEIIGDYWSNRNGLYYGKRQGRPAPQEFKYINNMGGWMATREQLYVAQFWPCLSISATHR
jgi:hypothetical protein